MTDAAPPSIRPASAPERPRTAGGRTVSSRAARSATGEQAPAGAPGVSGPSSSGEGSMQATTPRSDTPGADVAMGQGTGAGPDRPGTLVPPRPRDEAVTSTDAAPDAAPAPPATGPADPQDEPPSPLVVAVDATSTWLREVGGSAATKVTSAYAAVTHPAAEDAAMTTSPTVAPEQVSAPPESAGAAAAMPASVPTAARPVARPAGSMVAGPRRVRLAVSRVDPWSAMKLAFLLSVAAAVMLVVATAVVWGTLNGMSVFTRLNDLVTTIAGEESSIDLLSYVAFDKVLSAATLVGVVNVFLLTALGTIGAFLYNIVSSLVGGLYLTMTDE